MTQRRVSPVDKVRPWLIMGLGTAIALPNGLGWVDSPYSPFFLMFGGWLALGGTFDLARVIFGARGLRQD